MRNARNGLAFLVAMLFVVGSMGDAEAQRRRRRARTNNPAAEQHQATNGAPGLSGFSTRLRTLVQSNRLPTFQKHGKTYFATKNSTPMNQYTALSNNVVEFFISPGFHHLYTRIGDQTYSRIGGLSRSSYYRGSSERIGVLVELKSHEMERLKSYLDRAEANPGQVLGPFNYNGGRPPNMSNCTSYITNAPIGRNGESLGRVCGVGESGFPQGFLGSLMRSNNERVKAVVVHNPSGTFSENYRFNLE